MREPRDDDFIVPLPGVGDFRYGRRTFGDRLKIRSTFLGLTSEVGDGDPSIAMYAGFIATHRVLCVEAPAGWADLADIQLDAPGDPELKIIELIDALKDREDSFAKGVTKSGEASGEGLV